MAELSVIIPTLDEEVHIARAISSAAELGPVFVVDSCSADRTRSSASAMGAMVIEHRWEGYAAQKNWALENLPIETEWIFFLDADERIPSALTTEIREAIATPTSVGYLVPRRYVFLGRELKHAWWYPDYQLRLFRRDKGRFEDRAVHEHVVLDGAVGRLKTALVHENLKGISAFVDRHNCYSTLEAERLAHGRRKGEKRGSFLSDSPSRRRAFKDKVWFKIPFRPTVRFLWLYLVKRGILDGKRGLLFCRLIAAYETLIDAKLLEHEAIGCPEAHRTPQVSDTSTQER